MKKLKVLYMSNNLVKEWVEFQKLVSKNIIFQFEFIDSQAELQTLHELVFTGNPLHEKFLEDNDGKQEIWQAEVQKRLKPLKKLDGKILNILFRLILLFCFEQVYILFGNKKEVNKTIIHQIKYFILNLCAFFFFEINSTLFFLFDEIRLQLRHL